MKKNFKKSKFVILPALATLVLTGVASVTGTVAWFTASRAVSATASNFEAKNLSGNFKIQASNGVGTTATKKKGVDASSVTVNENTLMADASYDINNDVLYTKVLGEVNNSTQVTGYRTVGETGKYDSLDSTNLKAGSYTDQSATKVVYYALTWSYTFNYTFTDTTKTMDLFLDSAGSSFKNGNNEDLTGSGKGFRIGFIGTNKTILSADAETKHVISTTATSDDYSKEGVKYLTAGAVNEKALDNGSNNTSRPDYLGTFTPGTATSITLKVIAWFEGADSNVVNEKDLEAVKGGFGFYVREGATTTSSN